VAPGLTRFLQLLALGLARLPALFGTDAAARGAALAAILTAMGGAYVKLGQFLATRHDLLDPVVIAALSGLFDRVTPVDYAAIEAAITSELGAPVATYFADIDPVPIAAGSIAQVHAARLFDGTPVAIKVRRPGVAALIAIDIAIMQRVARLLTRVGADDTGLIAGLIDEFATMLRSELDLAAEAAAMAAIGARLPPGTRAPALLGPAPTPGQLVMERVEGVALTRLVAAPADLPGRLADACLAQFFVHGVFHGDPHPGNLLLADDGDIVFLDFGLHGVLSAADREAMARYVLALSAGRFRGALAELATTLVFAPGADPAAFRRAAIPVLRRWRSAGMDPSLPAAARSVGQFQVQLMAVMRRTGVHVDSRFALYFRALAMLDATALALPLPVDLPGLMRDFLMQQHVPEAAPRSLPTLSWPPLPEARDWHRLAATRPAPDRGWPATLATAITVATALLLLALAGRQAATAAGAGASAGTPLTMLAATPKSRAISRTVILADIITDGVPPPGWVLWPTR
jgi:ubiquinone biosynthesis protein